MLDVIFMVGCSNNLFIKKLTLVRETLSRNRKRYTTFIYTMCRVNEAFERVTDSDSQKIELGSNVYINT